MTAPQRQDPFLGLLSELILAAARLAGRRMGLAPGGEYVCLECGSRDRRAGEVFHRPGCVAGEVARLVHALASCAEQSQSMAAGEGAAPGAAGGCGHKRRRQDDGFGEPWTLNEAGEIVDAAGLIVVDPYGSTLAEEDEARVMRRIVACVNICDGLHTENLEVIAIAPVGASARGGEQ